MQINLAGCAHISVEHLHPVEVCGLSIEFREVQPRTERRVRARQCPRAVLVVAIVEAVHVTGVRKRDTAARTRVWSASWGHKGRRGGAHGAPLVAVDADFEHTASTAACNAHVHRRGAAVNSHALVPIERGCAVEHRAVESFLHRNRCQVRAIGHHYRNGKVVTATAFFRDRLD